MSRRAAKYLFLHEAAVIAWRRAHVSDEVYGECCLRDHLFSLREREDVLVLTKADGATYEVSLTVPDEWTFAVAEIPPTSGLAE